MTIASRLYSVIRRSISVRIGFSSNTHDNHKKDYNQPNETKGCWMSDLTLQLPDDLLNRLQQAAERQHIPLEDLIRKAIESYLDEADEPSKGELLRELRQSMHDAVTGNTRPADEVIEELRRKHQSSNDNS